MVGKNDEKKEVKDAAKKQQFICLVLLTSTAIRAATDLKGHFAVKHMNRDK